MATKFQFDAKEFLLQHGERVGLGVAGVLGALLLFFGLRGVFAANPSSNADNLAKLNKNRSDLIRTSSPNDEEKKQLASIDPKISGAVRFDPVDLELYAQNNPFWEPIYPSDTKRRAPRILQPEDVAVRLEHVQAEAYVLNANRDQVMMVKGGGGKTGASGLKNNVNMLGRMGAGMGFGRPGGSERGGGMGPKMPGSGGGSSGFGGSRPPGSFGMGGSERGGGGSMGMGMGGPVGPGSEMLNLSGESKGKWSWVPVDKADSKSDYRLAEDILPLRMAIVSGSFPYKQQLEEYRKALRLDSVEEVLNSPDAPQFDGFAVERAEVVPGRTDLQWEPLDLKKAFAPYALMLAEPRWEEEPAEMVPIEYYGLVMKRPVQFRPGSYKDDEETEKNLKHVKETLAQLREAEQGKIAKPKNRFKDSDNLNIFGDEEGGTKSNTIGEAVMGGGTGGLGARKPGTPGGGSSGFGRTGSGTGGASDLPPGTGGLGATNQVVIPEYILMRFLDVTIEPGKTYKYRFKVKVMNPNYDREMKRKDVAWKSLMRDKDLVSDWTVVPQPVKVESELNYYAVDLKTQGDLDEKKDIGWNAPLAGANQVPAQIQRWLVELTESRKSSLTSATTVADWVVAERVLLDRGEYLGIIAKANVPIRNRIDDDFTLAVAASSSIRRERDKRPLVFFGIDRENGPWESMLVDFTGGNLEYNRYGGIDEDKGKPITTIVRDKAPVEMLFMTADGKLSLHNSDVDYKDDTRASRYKEWKSRVSEAKHANKPGKIGGKGSNPFGPGGGS
jgi:hypothetical protein